MACFMTSAAIVTPATKNVVVRNLSVLFGLVLVGGAGLAYFILDAKALPGWRALALALCVLCAWFFLLELLGVVVTAETMSFPRRPLGWFPIVSIWRRRIRLGELDEMTLLRPWLGLQVVRLDGQFGKACLLFHSRSARLKFF